MQRSPIPLTNHDAVMVCVELDSIIESNKSLARKFKREENSPMNRYQHGYAEGVVRAKDEILKRFGVNHAKSKRL